MLHFENEYDHVNTLYGDVLRSILNQPSGPSPRGLQTKELIGVSFTLLNPAGNLLINPLRKVNVPFMLAEWLWITMGRNDLAMIAPYNDHIVKFSEEGYFRGAYGPKLVEQLPYVVDCLKKDRESRQAVISFWRERPRESVDVPCTLTMQFLLRQEHPTIGDKWRLHMIINMRSNDAWLGLPYDLFTFTMIQQQLATTLGVSLGEYHHSVGSLHLYERDWLRAEGAVNFDSGWAPSIEPVVGSMPKAFEAMFVGLTLLSSTGAGPGDVEKWLGDNADWIDAPWGGILRTLAYRFHQNKALVPPFWQAVMRGSVDG